MRRALVLLALALCLLVAASTAGAAPADLDRSFGGGDGIAEVPAPPASLPGETGGRMAIGPNDEIYVLYSNYSPACQPPFDCDVALTVARFTANGTPDPGFATDPQVVYKSDAYSHTFALAVGADGKPVLAAYGGAGLKLARIGLDGRLDLGFGVGGIAPSSGQAIESAHDFPSLAVQPDGKVVLAAMGAKDEASSELLVARYLADGGPDPGFGLGGEAALTLPTQSRPAGVFLGPGGTVTVPGPRCCLGGTAMFGEGFGVARLTAAGQPDPAWAGDGTLFSPTPGAQGTVEAAALAPDGSLFLSHEDSTATVSTIGNLIKLNPAGAADPSFGNGGALRLFNRVGSLSPTDFTVDGAGRLVGVGWEGRITVFRLRADGSKDRTFNGGEQIVLPYGGGGTLEYEVGVQSSGRIVAFGDSGLGSFQNFGLVALRGGSDRTRCLGKRATIVGTAKKDKLRGTSHRDVIAALGGADEVRGLAGPDLICGGKGSDKLFGGAGKDKVRP